jgi:enolase
MDMLAQAIAEAGFEGRVGLHVDFAATAYYNPETKLYSGLYDGKSRSREEMLELAVGLPKKYPVVIIQDPLEAADMEGFAAITRATDVQVVGSDVFGTDLARLEKCATAGCFNTAALRVHKYPTFSACARAAACCSRHDIGLMPVDTAGEDFDIVSYAVGFRAGSIGMSGLSSHGNRMSLAEREIGPTASFFGKYGLKGARFKL